MGRKAKVSKVAASVIVTDEEKAITAKYGSTHRIVAGSRTTKGLGNKTTVLVLCKACLVEERLVCTSDLQFPTTAYCLTCSKDVKRNAKDKKKVG